MQGELRTLSSKVDLLTGALGVRCMAEQERVANLEATVAKYKEEREEALKAIRTEAMAMRREVYGRLWQVAFGIVAVCLSAYFGHMLAPVLKTAFNK